MEITERFGEAIRSLRHGLGISQEALAERAGLHRTYVAGLESGSRNISLKSIEKLARALEVTMADLFLRVSATTVPKLRSNPTSTRGQIGANAPRSLQFGRTATVLDVSGGRVRSPDR
jgi:transcriptional regulator with XRE-family HTH domain